MSIHKHHYNCLVEFRRILFPLGLLTEAHLVKEMPVKRALQEEEGKIIEQEINKFYWVLQNDKSRYLLHTKSKGALPLIPLKTTKTGVGENAYKLITEFQRVEVQPENLMSFRSIVDSFCDFKHDSPDDWTLFKIIMLASWIDKTFIRLCSGADFGKDSVAIAENVLLDYVTMVSNPTIAKLAYSAIGSRTQVINEVSNLAAQQRRDIQDYFLDTCAGQPTWTKPSRATNGVGEIIDITKLSVVVFYNLYKYYVKAGQDYFDHIFTEAVKDRLLPICFPDGMRLDKAQFRDKSDLKDVAQETKALNIKIMKTVKWLATPSQNIAFNYLSVLHNYRQGKHLGGRQGMTFDTLCRFINLYAHSQEEYDKLEALLYQRNQDYYAQFEPYADGKLITEVEEIE